MVVFYMLAGKFIAKRSPACFVATLICIGLGAATLGKVCDLHLEKMVREGKVVMVKSTSK